MPTIEEVTSKACLGCGLDLPLSAFHRHPLGKLGRHPRCRDCKSLEWQEYKRRNPNRQAANSRRRRHEQGEPASCEWCGSGFLANKDRRSFCSKECAYRGWPLRRLRETGEVASVLPWAQCMRCRGWFMARSGLRLCREQDCIEARAHSLYYQPVPRRACEVCGEVLRELRGNTRWCSDDCYRTTPEFRARRRQTKRRRRARKRSAVSVAYAEVEIFERDGWRCRLCGKKVNRKVEVPHPLAATVDHIVPYADGGADVPANVQTAHFICNSKKGERTMPGGEQLMLIG